MSYKLVHERLKRRGWTLEQSLGLKEPPPQNSFGRNKRPVTIGGRNFDTLADAARAYNLSPKIVNNRVNKLKWPLAKALGVRSATEKIKTS